MRWLWSAIAFHSEDVERKVSEREIEVEGHLVDSMILTRIFDRIMDLKGDFEVLEFNIGKHKTDYSYAKMVIRGRDESHLEAMLQELYRLGATPVKLDEVELAEASSDTVLPDEFYSTSNNPTSIYLKEKWIEVEDMMMDKAIVVDLDTLKARCKPIREVKHGELIVVGDKGVRVKPPERPRTGVGIFEFMTSRASPEKPSPSLIRQVATYIVETKQSGRKIIVVAGPAVVHTGAAPSLAKMIRLGYVDALLAGNALAVHDVESALYGTSLGVKVENGSLTLKGNRNHLMAINEVLKAGSIEDLVRSGVLKEGIMYECVVRRVPYALAGSIRDDGPIPGVITDTVNAQHRYAELLRDAGLVIMMATTLHSIAVGNMIPSTVQTIYIDINPAVVTKLMDRGTAHAAGIISEIGAFLPHLVDELEKMREGTVQQSSSQ